MKLLHVAIDGVGRFGTPARLEGLGPGVNILSAHNEAGKSTMFRAIRTCLFERHNTTRDEVKKLATEGLSLPVKMTIGFEHEGQTFELTKSFLRSPSAKLTRNGVEIARNREADERLWEILGITPDNKIDQGAYGVLWVEQGQSFYVPEPSEAAASVLNNVIQQEVGTLVGGERARQLLKDVRDELGKLLTDSGKSKSNGPLGLAQRQLETLEQQRIDAEKRLSELDVNLEALAILRTELARLDDPAESRRRSDELESARTNLNAAEESARILRRFENDERQAFELFEAQDNKLKGLRQRTQVIDENRTRFKRLSNEAELVNEALATTKTALAATASRQSKLERDVENYDAEDSKLQRLATVGVKAQQRDASQSRLELLQSYEKRLFENGLALKSIAVDDAAVKALAALELESEKINARMESAAARLTIEAGRAAHVVVNGAPLTESLSRPVTEPLTIAIGDDVSITVSPPLSSLVETETASREQHAKLRDLLRRYGAASTGDLRQMLKERTVLEEDSRQLKGERIALGLKEATAAPEIMRRQIEIKQHEAETAKALADTGVSELPAPAEIERQRQVLQRARSELKATLAQAVSLTAGLTTNVNQKEQARAALSGQLKELEASIAAELALLPDAGRQQLLDDAERERDQRAASHRASATLLGEKRQSAPAPDDLERLHLRFDRLRGANSNQLAKLDKLRVDIARLEGQVQSAGGDGLGERAAELQADSAIALEEVSRQTERASVLQLLRTVVEEAYDKRREQLNAPLHRHLKPFLQDVFPQAEIALGDGFNVEGLKRTGPASELFGRLSHGTQEQIAVLVRLAMGAMICEKGHDVPIILDDALVYSDDARIERMFDAISRAGRNQQVIVLTCRARSFAGLGGNPLHIT